MATSNLNEPQAVVRTHKRWSPQVVALALGILATVASSAAARQLAYVTDVVSYRLHAIDVASNTVAASIELGARPNGLAITPDGAYAYVSSDRCVPGWCDDSLTNTLVVNTWTNTIDAVIPGTGQPPGPVTVSTDGSRAYVGNLATAWSGGVTVLDTATNSAVASVGLGARSGNVQDLAAHPSGGLVVGTECPWCEYCAPHIFAFDTATNRLIDLGLGLESPCVGDIAVSPDGARTYVTGGPGGDLQVLDTARLASGAPDAILRSLRIGSGPRDVVFAPSGTVAYVALFDGNAVAVVDTATDAVTALIPVGSRPIKLAITPDGALLYVSNDGSGNISVIDTGTNAVISTITGVGQPRHIAIAEVPVALDAPFVVRPNTGGDTGAVSVVIHNLSDVGFAPGATVRLVRSGQADIAGSPVDVSADGRRIGTTFNLCGKTRGLWNISVSNPDGTSLIVPDGFTIEEGRSPHFWMDIVGRDAIRAGSGEEFTIVYGNRGNVDAPGALVHVKNPKDASVRFLAPAPEGLNLRNLTAFETEEMKIAEFVTPRIPPGSAIPLRMRLTIPVPVDGQLEASWVSLPAPIDVPVDPAAQITGEVLEHTPTILSTTFHIASTAGSGDAAMELSIVDAKEREAPKLDIDTDDRGGLRLTAEMTADLVGELSDEFPDGRLKTIATDIRIAKSAWDGYVAIQEVNDSVRLVEARRQQYPLLLAQGLLTEEQVASLAEWNDAYLWTSTIKNVADVAGLSLNPLETLGLEALVSVLQGAPDVELAFIARNDPFRFIDRGVPQECFMRLFPDVICIREALARIAWRTPAGSQSHQFRAVAARDPNEKVGSQGVGGPRYVVGEEPLPYAVLFENVETATAPAQEVVITDQLDPALVDLSTLQLGPIVFGEHQIVAPSGQPSFTQDVDLRPANNLIVRVAAQLDAESGLLTWRFSSLDPDTGLPPEDPLAGFLPPNLHPPEGNGSVFFTVMPKAGLATGTEIRNSASILFDANAPIRTPEWFNTIDASKPQSHATMAGELACTQGIQVAWSGNDTGSGLRDYTVYVSEDGGIFVPWMSNTPTTNGLFLGAVAGKTYAFYSIARDEAGNVESAPDAPDIVATAVDCVLHDSVVVPRRPLTIKLPDGRSAVTRTFRVKVRNADHEGPTGHRIRLTALDGSCPEGTVGAPPDFNRRVLGQQDSVHVAGGATKTATVTLNVRSPAFISQSRRNPYRCWLTLIASADATDSFDPTPGNNVVTVELNVTTPEPVIVQNIVTHESVIGSIAPLAVRLKAGTTELTKTVKVVVSNADVRAWEGTGHDITLGASDGDCPPRTVAEVDCDPLLPGPQDTRLVGGGASARCVLQIDLNATLFPTSGTNSPSRCTAVLRVAGPDDLPESELSNNTTKLVVDVVNENIP